ncbi:Major Facilitator Superfamily protein [Rhodobacteraceae bacterium THAF1]|uniref:MFS transporter n=1 Tax=Palleronia sp. THAF1 TaxID=2587842 RepID=UPI000F40697E|nr:MFS transporter [Palleronia sp. THAF1]QFU10146.1 Major Facilitator Superfamily protein [Palleronia sp. THAF1]VDC16949.1 Major Facilitator Superfamily protein [Rhodobacteraceae bacterium THAF1]
MSFLTFLRANAPFLAVGVLLTFCSSFGQTFFISVFAGNIRGEFALTNGDWGLLYSIGTTASAAVMIWTGILTDTFRVRILGPVVLAMLALACLSMWAASGWWSLAFTIFALRFAGQGMATLVATVAMARWFVASRGKALSVSKIGVSLGEAFLPLIFVALMAEIDWRTLWLISGGIIVALIPLLWPLLRLERTPKSIASDSQAVGMRGLQWTRKMMLSHPLYWLIVPMLIAPAAFSTAFFFHQVHLAEAKGWSHLGLVATFPVFTAAAAVSMFTSGPIIDRVGTARLMPIVLLPMGVGFAGFAFAPSLATATIFTGLMGLSQGLNSTVPAAFWAEFYGTRYLGGIKALAAAVMVFGTAIGPALTGILIDAGIAFPQQMWGIGVYFFVAAGLVWIGIKGARGSLPAQVDVERA